MQILHPFSGSIQQYCEQLADPDRYRPAACPLCQVREPLTSHGFYQRTVVDETVDGFLRVRRYLCRCCWRTVSLLPEFLLPYLRFSVSGVARFLTARLGEGQTLRAAAQDVANFLRTEDDGELLIAGPDELASGWSSPVAGSGGRRT